MILKDFHKQTAAQEYKCLMKFRANLFDKVKTWSMGKAFLFRIRICNCQVYGYLRSVRHTRCNHIGLIYWTRDLKPGALATCETNFMNVLMTACKNMFNSSCGIYELEGIAAFSVNILSAFFGSFGNILICVTVFSSPRLHKAWCYFICSLSVADLMVNLCVQPMEAILTLERMAGVCKQSLRDAFRLAAYITCGASLLNLAFMSVERLLAIAWPFSPRRVLTRRKFVAMTVIIWGVPSFLGITGYMIGKGTRLSSILVLIGLAGCYGVILTSYGILFLRTRAHFKVNNVMTLTVSEFGNEGKNGANSPSAWRVSATRTAVSKKRRESEKRAAKTIAVVITVFTLSWVPYGYVLVSDPEQHVNSFYIWAVTIGLTNSAVNPVIYFFSSKDFRKNSKRILRPIFRCWKDPLWVIIISGSWNISAWSN